MKLYYYVYEYIYTYTYTHIHILCVCVCVCVCVRAQHAQWADFSLKGINMILAINSEKILGRRSYIKRKKNFMPEF